MTLHMWIPLKIIIINKMHKEKIIRQYEVARYSSLVMDGELCVWLLIFFTSFFFCKYSWLSNWWTDHLCLFVDLFFVKDAGKIGFFSSSSCPFSIMKCNITNDLWYDPTTFASISIMSWSFPFNRTYLKQALLPMRWYCCILLQQQTLGCVFVIVLSRLPSTSLDALQYTLVLQVKKTL